MLRKNQVPASRRRGVILLVVLAMLTLFAILGITFVYYASAEEDSARIAREGEAPATPDMNPELALSMFLGQLIYDLPDDAAGVYSSLRGNSLARSMYGLNMHMAGGNTNSNPTNAPDDKPYIGVGRLHYPSPLGGTGYGADDSYLINFTYFASDGFLRDPERYPSRAGLTAPRGTFTGGFNVPYTYPDHHNPFLSMIRPSDGTVLVPSFHRPWIFNPNWPNPTPYANNPNWTNKAGKYLTIWVRPEDMNNGTAGQSNPAVGFPLPDVNDRWVKNLDWAPGGADSGWVDIGAPVMTTADGRKYKMLVSPLIIELDSRLNLNVVGNILGMFNTPNPTHASNQGWGITEVNPMKVLNSISHPNQWQNIFLGNARSYFASPLTLQRTPGRYGLGGVPKGNAILGGNPARVWGPGDLNGLNDPGLNPNPWTPTQALHLPGVGSKVTYQNFPTLGFPVNPTGYDDGYPAETTNTGLAKGTPIHPLMFNSQRPAAGNHLIPLDGLFELLRYNGTNSDALSSDLFRLLPNNLTNVGTNPADPQTVRRRNLVTLLSAALDRPHATPFIVNPNDPNTNATTTTRFQFNTATGATPSGWTALFPTANPIPYPALNPAIRNPPLGTAGTIPTGDFNPLTLASIAATMTSAAALAVPPPPTLPQGSAFERVDLNRPLTPYPAPNPVTFPFNPAAPPGVINLTLPADTLPAPNTKLQQFLQAQADRQQFAQDLFTALQKATGALDLGSIFAQYPTNWRTAPEYRALRYLAQLAVNIVDYIDYDDYATPFTWNNPPPGVTPPAGFFPETIFGTELPRLVLNEVYASLDNLNNDPGLKLPNPVPNPPPVLKPTGYQVNLWAELHNPFITDTTPNGWQAAGGGPLPDQNAILHNGVYAPYTIDIIDPGASTLGANPLVQATLHQNLRSPGNVLGDPLYNPVTGYNPANPATLLPPPAVGWSVVGKNPSTAYLPTVAGVPIVQPTNPAAGYYRVVGPNNNAYAVNNQTPTAMTPLVPPPQPPLPLATQQFGFYVLGPDAPLGAIPGLGKTANNNPGLPVTSQVQSMSYTVPAGKGVTTAQLTPVVLLRRLACPGLPPNPTLNPATGTPNAINPALPYNPYITVDYVEFAPREVHDARLQTAAGRQTPNTNTFHSRGRTQPYTAEVNQRWKQTPNPASPAPQPQNTFFRHNAVEGIPPPQLATPNQTLKIPFDWLVHLDRQLISPIELLHVSGFKPHELTQQFVGPGANSIQPLFGRPFQHIAPWTNESTRLYRSLEYVQTRSRAAGVARGGRVPGRININMLWDTVPTADNAKQPNPSVFQALCDAQPGNWFSYTLGNPTQPLLPPPTDNVGTVLQRFLNPTQNLPANLKGTFGRSMTPDGAGGYMPGHLDAPIWPFSIGPNSVNPATPPAPVPNVVPDPLDPNAVVLPATPTPRGIQNTLLRCSVPPNYAAPPYYPLTPGGQTLTFDPYPIDTDVTHPINPYVRLELLNKIYNNISTHSNVFAVFVTVGFFEVAKDPTGTTYIGDQFLPVKLGAEIGFAEGRNIRHRMFAIVDRSQLTAFSTTSTQAVTVPGYTNPPHEAVEPAVVQIQLTQTAGTSARTGRPWAVQANSVLVYDPNTDYEETIVVQQDATGKLWGKFRKSHAAGCSVISRGNPGPWPRYNPRNDTAVVPFFAIIQ
jgi:hypothetical protein